MRGAGVVPPPHPGRGREGSPAAARAQARPRSAPAARSSQEGRGRASRRAAEARGLPGRGEGGSARPRSTSNKSRSPRGKRSRRGCHDAKANLRASDLGSRSPVPPTTAKLGAPRCAREAGGGSPAARRPPRDGPRLRPAPPRPPRTPPAPARSGPLEAARVGQREPEVRSAGGRLGRAGGRGGVGGGSEEQRKRGGTRPSAAERDGAGGEEGGEDLPAPWQQVYACVRRGAGVGGGGGETARKGGAGGFDGEERKRFPGRGGTHVKGAGFEIEARGLALGEAARGCVLFCFFLRFHIDSRGSGTRGRRQLVDSGPDWSVSGRVPSTAARRGCPGKSRAGQASRTGAGGRARPPDALRAPPRPFPRTPPRLLQRCPGDLPRRPFAHRSLSAFMVANWKKFSCRRHFRVPRGVGESVILSLPLPLAAPP